MSNWLRAKDALRIAGDKGMARCPVHDDRISSLSVKRTPDDDVLLHCFAGCDYRAIRSALGLGPRHAVPAPALAPNPSASSIKAEYVYLGEDGRVVAIKRRFEPKRFEWLTEDATGRLRPGLDPTLKLAGVPLFHFPECLTAARLRETVLVVEGEKDASNLIALGFTATTTPEGASGGHGPERWRTLIGASFILLPDNDEPGRAHMHAIARTLTALRCDVGILELPNLPPKGDVSDWIEAQKHAGQTLDAIAAEVGRLVAHAIPWIDPDTSAAGIAALDANGREAWEERAGIIEANGVARPLAEGAAWATVSATARTLTARLTPAQRLARQTDDPDTLAVLAFLGA